MENLETTRPLFADGPATSSEMGPLPPSNRSSTNLDRPITPPRSYPPSTNFSPYYSYSPSSRRTKPQPLDTYLANQQDSHLLHPVETNQHNSCIRSVSSGSSNVNYRYHGTSPTTNNKSSTGISRSQSLITRPNHQKNQPSFIPIPPRSPGRFLSVRQRQSLYLEEQRHQLGLSDTYSSRKSSVYYCPSSSSLDNTIDSFISSSSSDQSSPLQPHIATMPGSPYDEAFSTSVEQVVQSFITDELSILDSFGSFKDPAGMVKPKDPPISSSTTTLGSTTTNNTSTRNVSSPLTPISSKTSDVSAVLNSTSSPASSVDQQHSSSTASTTKIASPLNSTKTSPRLRKSTSIAGKLRSFAQRRTTPTSHAFSSSSTSPKNESNSKKPLIGMKFGSES